MSSHRFEARTCGEVRTTPKAPKATRYSGRAVIDIQYLAAGESWDTDKPQYAWTIWVDGKRVNACAHGLAQYVDRFRGPSPEKWRSSPEAYDEEAAAACRWTVHELDANPDSPGMDSGMDGEDFNNALEHDEEWNVVVRRTP